MPLDDAERWVVNLIRNERLNAKIDAQAGVVVMVNAAPSVYEQIIDRTKGLSFQTFHMANTLLTAAATPAGVPGM
jgi:translation initiation factor 3 subunit E